MVLARIRIRDDLVADISERTRLRIVLGETEKVKLVDKDQDAEIEAPDGQVYYSQIVPFLVSEHL